MQEDLEHRVQKRRKIRDVELNRRMPNGTYGGVVGGQNPPYPIMVQFFYWTK